MSRNRNPKSKASQLAAGRRKMPKLDASSSAPQPPSPPWLELPGDLTANILQSLGAEDLLQTVQKVCTTWRSVCKQPSVWRKIHLSRDSIRHFEPEIMCRHAVDRSLGQLLDVSLNGFGSDSLLTYISERSSGLRCLSLEFCRGITRKGLVEAAKGLPLLEELCLSLSSIDAACVEQVGRSCPALKSFTLRMPTLDRWLISYDTEALAIAKTMSQLRHLCLDGILMFKEDLVAILDSCTHLESLHLKQCKFYPGIDDDLAKRLSQQIRHLEIIECIHVNHPKSYIVDADYLSYLINPPG